MERVNIHIYPSPFKNESRILKITKTLEDNKVFDKIYIIATWEIDLPEKEDIGTVREVVRIRGTLSNKKSGNFGKILKILQWYWNIFKFLMRKKIGCINCHNLSILPLCVLLKILKQAKLIYDTHELETETTNSIGFRKRLSKITEKFFMPFIDETVVVNENIARWYQDTYGLKKVWVVKNVPYYREGEIKKTSILRDTFKIQKEDILFLYQGLIGYGRGIKLLLKIFSQLNADKHIVFLGYGSEKLIEQIMEYNKHYSNIHYFPAVKPGEVPYYTASADVGISLIENVCMSYYLCLPNKMFEYVSCGVPAIVSDFPVMSSFIDKYNCGWKVKLDEESVVLLINGISQASLIEKQEYTRNARKNFGWHLEEPTLLSVYKQLGF